MQRKREVHSCHHCDGVRGTKLTTSKNSFSQEVNLTNKVRSRKRSAAALDADTLASIPVWRFLTEGESADPNADESFVRAQSTPPAIGEHASYLVAATYTLANGRRLPGLVQVDVLGSHAELDPCAIYASGKQVDPLSKDAEMRLTRILHEENTRPVEWELAVSMVGENQPRRGAISASLFMQVLGLLAKLARLKRL